MESSAIPRGVLSLSLFDRISPGTAHTARHTIFSYLLHVEDYHGSGVHPVERSHQCEGHDDGVHHFHRARERGRVEQRRVRPEVRHEVHDLDAAEETAGMGYSSPESQISEVPQQRQAFFGEGMPSMFLGLWVVSCFCRNLG